MGDNELLREIEKVIDLEGAPLLAREIADTLQRRGIVADRSSVNSALYRQEMLVKDTDHRWSPLAARAVQVVDAAGAPLLAKEIAATLSRRGMSVDRARVNRALYAQTQTMLLKGDDHRWSRVSSVTVALDRSGTTSAAPSTRQGWFETVWARLWRYLRR